MIRPENEAGRGGAVFDTEFREDSLKIFADRTGFQAQDFGDLGIRFSARDPGKDFDLALREEPGRTPVTRFHRRVITHTR